MNELQKNLICRLVLLFFLFGMGNLGFTQPAEANRWYQKLDLFLAKPTPENLNHLENETLLLETTSKESQLAQVITLCNIGYYNLKFNRLLKSIAYYEKAKTIFFTNRLSGYNIIEYCLQPLGNLYTQTNALSEAENTIKQYLLLAQEQQNNYLEASALVNLSVVYKSLGQYDKAIKVLKQAKTINPKHNLITLQLAENYIKKEDFTRAEAILEKEKKQLSATSKTYLLQAEIAIEKQQFKLSKTFYQKAITLQQSNPNTSPRTLAKTHLLLANLQLETKNYLQAATSLNQIYQILIPDFSPKQLLPKKDQLYAENTLLDALDTQAKLFTLQNQPEKALLCYERANTVSELLFSQAHLRQSKINFQTQRKNRFEKMLTLIYEQYQTTKELQWVQKAVLIDAASKSFILYKNQQLTSLLKKHRSDTLVRRFFKIRTQLEQVKNKLESLKTNHFTRSDSLFVWQQKFSNLVTQQRELLREINTKYKSEKYFESNINLEELQQKLQELNQTVVSYFFGSNQVFQLIINQNEIRFNRLMSTKRQRDSLFNLCVKINRFYKDASQINNHPQEYVATAYSLFTQLNIPETDKLTIIPDGMLSFIPFDALVMSKTVSVSYATIPFLVSKTQVSYRLSIWDLVQNKNNTIAKASTVLGVFPEFKGTSKELSFSLEEAEVIGDHFNSTVLKGKQATITALLKNLPDYDVIHLSTHASGGTFTSSPVIELIDGNLSVNTFYGLNLDTQLVVLSACETGVGKLIKGEGVINLARGFTYAGTQNVLFTLWNVNDYATAQIMQGFYKHIVENTPTTQALTLSKRGYLKNKTIENSKKSPFYWASFVYYGEPIYLIPKTQNYWVLGLTISFVVGFFIMLIFFYKKNNKKP